MTSPWTDQDRASWRHCTTLESMRGWWKGSDCVVVAGGPSATPDYFRLSEGWRTPHWLYSRRWMIACNRSARWDVSDFAACFEPRKDLDVWQAIKDTPALLLSHIERDHPRTVLTGSKLDVTPWITGEPNDGGDLVLGQSTFFAIACAIVLGFKTIGVIGLDLSEDRYDHSAMRDSHAAYRALNAVAMKRGHRILNLNPDSRLKALPFGEWADVRCK